MNLHPSAQKVSDVLKQLGYQGEVVEHESSTRTAAEAAQAAGCEIGQIVKSLVFQLEPAGVGESAYMVLVLVSGMNRVHEKRLGRQLGGKLVRADADHVRETSGYSIGGIPPVGHKIPLKTYIDEDLLLYPLVWAAAGTPNAVFQIQPQELVTLTQGTIVNVK